MNDIVTADKVFLTRHWWALAIRGVIAIALGLLALVWPGLFAEAVILVFGIYFLIQGLFTLFSAADLRREPQRGSLVFHGLIGIGVGLVLLLLPGVFAVIVIWVVAFWALVTGILEIGAALNLPAGGGGKWLFSLSGVFSIVIGIVLLAHPGAGILAVLWLIGIYAILAGLTMLGLALHLRRLSR
jgi:uncharacterized membrane protein HdeD (DUF308 family)